MDSRSHQATHKRSDYRDPPGAASISQAIVAKSGNGREQPRSEITGGVNWVAVHAAEAHANNYDDQPNHQRREVRSRRQIEFVSDRKDEEKQ